MASCVAAAEPRDPYEVREDCENVLAAPSSSAPTLTLGTPFVQSATGWLLPGIGIDNYLTAIILSVILGLLNTFVKPVLVFLSAPITLVTLGLFIFIIDAFIIEMASSLLDGFVVNGFGWAMLFSIVLSITTSLLGKIIDKE